MSAAEGERSLAAPAGSGTDAPASDPYTPATRAYGGEPSLGRDTTYNEAATYPDDAYQTTTALYGHDATPRPLSDSPPSKPFTPTTEAYDPSQAEAPPPALSASSDDPLAGTPYRTIVKLGAGGMGDVYEAEDLEVGGRVVVKLRREPERPSAKQRPVVDRMDREAEALARLHHPNIVQVSRYSRTPGGRPYIAMERLYGRNLREELRKVGPLASGEAVSVLRQVLAGLAAAHAIGVIHRDIKLDNLFWCEAVGGHRTVKILDFGLTKWLAGAEGAPAGGVPTAHDVFVGTPRYAAPEQVDGAVDERTDIYAVGLVLYALLSGREPFSELKRSGELLRAHRRRSLDFEFQHPIPGWLERVLHRALAKEPDERYATAAEFSEALDAGATSGAEGAFDLRSSSTASYPLRPMRPSDFSEHTETSSSDSIPVRKPRFGLLLMAAVVLSAGAFALLTSIAMRWAER